MARIKYSEGSDNVFADLGLTDADEYLGKAELARQIIATIARRGVNQREAAEILGIDQPKVSLLKHGKLDGFSMDRLVKFLLLLDQELHIQVRPAISGGRVIFAPASDITNSSIVLKQFQLHNVRISDPRQEWLLAAPLAVAEYPNTNISAGQTGDR